MQTRSIGWAAPPRDTRFRTWMGDPHMSKTVVVRYRTRPDAAEENARLVEGVFASLAELEPDGFRNATYRLADGVTFVHVAHLAGAENPLPTFPRSPSSSANWRSAASSSRRRVTRPSSAPTAGLPDPAGSGSRESAKGTNMRSYE